MSDRPRQVDSSVSSVAVVIATRDRPAQVAESAEAVLRSRCASFELCIVDQSSDQRTMAALETAACDPRVTVVHSATRGVAAGRNLGVSFTRAPIVAFTDDDCRVDPGWIEAMARAFARDPRIGMVFGTLVADAYDRRAGFIQAYQVRAPRLATRLSDKSFIDGIGGCMAVRRVVFEALQGFDELCGVGAPLRAAEDTDFAIRTLMAGHAVYETPEIVATHLGFRTWREGRPIIEGYLFGLGAVYVKMLRLAGVRGLRPVASLAWRWVAAGPAVDLNGRPPRWLRLAAFSRGAWTGWRVPLDRASGLFVARKVRRVDRAAPIRDDVVTNVREENERPRRLRSG
jgi:glycosyltransferase involved in cell wall biosynthesis